VSTRHSWPLRAAKTFSWNWPALVLSSSVPSNLLLDLRGSLDPARGPDRRSPNLATHAAPLRPPVHCLISGPRLSTLDSQPPIKTCPLVSPFEELQRNMSPLADFESSASPVRFEQELTEKTEIRFLCFLCCLLLKNFEPFQLMAKTCHGHKYIYTAILPPRCLAIQLFVFT
jgi:hypothetical protein